MGLTLCLWSVCGLLRLWVGMSMLLLAEDLQLQEELLLLEEPGVCRVHGWGGLLCLLVRRNILVILELLHFWLHIFGLLVAILV